MQGLLIFLLVLMVAAAVACVILGNNSKSIISLALLSVILAIVMFLIGDFWSAIFELFVCGGLLTAVLIAAINLTHADSSDPEEEKCHRKRVSILPVFMILLGIAMLIVLSMSGFNLQPVSSAVSQLRSFNDVFWNTRQADIIGQMVIIVTGALAVMILFKEDSRHE